MENKKALLAVTAHDVVPIELVSSCLPWVVTWGVPYSIIKGKARLARLVQRKISTTDAFTQVKWEDKGALANLLEAMRTNNNDRQDEIYHDWGGQRPRSKVGGSHCQVGKSKGLKNWRPWLCACC